MTLLSRISKHRLLRGLCALLAVHVVSAVMVRPAGALSTQVTAVSSQELRWYEGETWNTTNGLPQNSVNEIVQTKDGFLWLATMGGLVRFDGIDFELFDLAREPNPGDNRISALCEDGKGNLWIATEGGFHLVVLRDGEFVPVQDSGKIRKLCRSSRGGVWAATRNGLFYGENDSLAHVVAVPIDKSMGIRNIAEAEDGSVWIAAGSLFRWDGHSLIQIEGTQGLHDIAVAGDGRMWAAGERLVELTGTSITQEFEGKRRGVLVDKAGTVWSGTAGAPSRVRSGVAYAPGYRITGAIEELFGSAGIPRLQDREGNLWFGDSVNGLLRLRRCRIEGLTIADGLKAQGVYSVASDRVGGLYVANKRSLLHYDGAGFDFVLPPSRRAEGGTFYATLVDAEGALWFSRGFETYRLLGGKISKVECPESGINRVLLQDSSDRIWLGAGKGLFLLGENGFERFDLDGVVQDSPVYCIREDRDGNLWFGFESGVSRLSGDQIDSWGEKDGLSRGAVREILQAPDGAIWAGTYGGGLCRLKNDAIARVTVQHGLLDNAISCALVDDNGFVYINSNRGVFRTHWDDLNAVADGQTPALICISYGVAPGMRTNEAQGGYQPAGCRDANGSMWFATIEGMVRLDPHEEVFNAQAPSVVFSKIESGGVSLELNARIDLPLGQRSLSVDYAALSFTWPESVRYRYKLIGRDSDWHDVGTERTARYSQLDPGQYTFKVLAANEDGMWSQTAGTFELAIPAYFYETNWFRGLVVILSVVGVLGLFRFRTRSIAARAQILEERIAEGTAELRQARDDLERRVAERTQQLAAANNSLQSDLIEREQLEAKLMHSQKLESVGRLAGGIAHDFNNLLTVMLGQIELAIMGARHEAIRQGLEEAYQAGQRASMLTQQLLVFARGKVGEHKSFSPEKLIRDLERMLTRLLKDDIKLGTEFAEDLGWIRADPIQVEQVLVNLCVNGGDAMPRGGQLKITAHNRMIEGAEQVPGSNVAIPKGAYVQISVADSGTGMDEATLTRIFEPFFTTKSVGKGSGLGLSVCYGIVQNSSGYISVQSELGVGTTVDLYFPLIEPTADLIAESTLVKRGALKARALLVEDDARVRRVVEAMLQELNIEVVSTGNGAKAIDLLQEMDADLDLLITDLVMPGMNGAEVANRVRALRPDTHVLFISGYSEGFGVGIGNLPENSNVLAKPFSLEALRQALSDVLYRQADSKLI